MISKELFIRTMERLELLNDKMNAVDDALSDLSQDFCGFYIPEIVDIIVDLLTAIFKDKNEWLSYCVYEHDFLHTIKPHSAKDKNDQPIDLTSWGNVYDFLIKNMEE